ncbi:MAG TPA: SigE family RNA polymerase sigma factor [Actinomycetota bacterium]
MEGDRGRLGELYVRHAPSSLRLAYLLTGDRELAEDLVQEAFARLVGRLAHLRDVEAFPVYLRQIVVNLSRMHFRRRSVERAYLRREERNSSNEGVQPDFDLREDLWKAIRNLPERQRTAIVLHFYEDLTEGQASEILGCRPGTYRSLISRGMQTLRTGMRGVRDG